MNAQESLVLLLQAVAARICYEAMKHPDTPAPESPATCDRKLTRFQKSDNVEPMPSLPPQVRQWQRKELQRYKEAQEKKWRNWTEAMFQPKS